MGKRASQPTRHACGRADERLETGDRYLDATDGQQLDVSGRFRVVNATSERHQVDDDLVGNSHDRIPGHIGLGDLIDGA